MISLCMQKGYARAITIKKGIGDERSPTDNELQIGAHMRALRTSIFKRTLSDLKAVKKIPAYF